MNLLNDLTRLAAGDPAPPTPLPPYQPTASELSDAKTVIDTLELRLKEAAKKKEQHLKVMDLESSRDYWWKDKEKILLAGEVEPGSEIGLIKGPGRVVADWLAGKGLGVAVVLDKRTDKTPNDHTALVLVASGWM